MRPNKKKNDPFSRRKDVHVTVDRDVYAKASMKIFSYGLSKQEVLEEFFRLIANEENRAMKLVESCYMNKVKQQVDALKGKRDLINEDLDTNAIYNLIQMEREDVKRGQEASEDDDVLEKEE
jgi:hypothetical protein